MQGFWWKIRAAIQKFMIGRHGADQLSLALLYTAVALNLLSLVPGLTFLSTIAMVMLVFSIFRTLSRNHQKRYQENAWFLKTFGDVPKKVKQFFARLKNARKYVYFSCPNCHAKLRVPRGAGDVTVTCGQCGNRIQKKV